MRVFAMILVLRSRVGLTAIVRTLHNSSPHERPGWTDRHVLRLLDRVTTEWIFLSDAVDSHPGTSRSVIPHGELASWYARFGQSEERVASTDVLNFGLVREYKGVEDLVRVAEELPEVTFRIAGRVGDLELGRRLEGAAARLSNVSLDFRHIPDGTLAEYIRTAKLVVLPYRRFENSGAAMVALQMGVPVLIPSGSFADALRSDFPLLIRTFSSPLSNHHIRQALSSSIAGASKSQSTTDREWPQQARAHGLVYQRAASRLRFNAS